MRMKKIGTVVGAAFVALALVWAPQASADTMKGGFSVSGPFEWVDDAGVDALITAATGVDFEASGGTNTPNVAGNMVVVTRSGDFTAFLTPFVSTGTITDFAYKGTTSSFPSPIIAAFELTNGITVDLLSFTSILTSCASGCDGVSVNPALTIQGTTTIKKAGFDDTKGTFAFTGGNAGGGDFSFTAQNNAVPEPTSMILLGLGLTGAVLGRRLKK